MVYLIHWGWVTHICIGNLTIISSDNGFSPGRRQTIIWTNAGILLIGPLGTNFSKILIEIIYNIFIQGNAFKTVICETVTILPRPQYVNSLCPDFFLWNTNLHFNVVWFIYIEMLQVNEIQGKHENQI